MNATTMPPQIRRDGVAIHLSLPPIEDASATDSLAALNRLSQVVGWETAIRQHYASSPGYIDYALNPERAKFLPLLKLTRDDRVLEIGPGLGQFTRAMATQVRSVDALEVVEGQAVFVHDSCRQAGLKNVTVACGGDDCKLPYTDQQFDVVVLNLVLEWCGDRSNHMPAQAMQTRLLKEIERVLKPGGRLFLSTKNRYALRYLLGKADEHAHHIHFGNALPRRLMMAILRAKGHSGPTGWLHSHRRLQCLLDHAGFGQRTNFWAAPEMRNPTHYVPIESVAIRLARQDPEFRQGEMRSTSALMRWIPSGLIKYFTPGHVLLAQKPL